MKAAWCFAVALVAACLVTRADAAADLKVGNTYSGSVKIIDTMSGIYLPLPSGEWKLIGLGTIRSRLGEVAMLGGRFVAVELDSAKRPRAFLNFVVATEASINGWKRPEFCEQKNLHYVEPKDVRQSRSGGEIRCWGIVAQSMHPADNAEQYVRDAYDWIAKNTKGAPQTTLRTTFVRASGPKYLIADYMFSPEAAHLPRWSNVAWDPARIVANSDQARYIETLKHFGNAWSAKVERGFSGMPLSEADVALAPEADPMQANALPPGGYRACADEQKLKGYSSGQKVLITFDNRSGSDIMIHTLDGDGQRKVQGTVQNGHWRRLPTFVSQPWVVTDAAGKCLRVVMPGGATERVVLPH
jgi:hypothetical protein